MMFGPVRRVAFRLQGAGTSTEQYPTKQEETVTNEALKGPDWQVAADLSVSVAVEPHGASFPQRVSVIGPPVPQASLVSQPVGPAV